MAYERINWQNEPSEATALNDVNLNKMDSAIYDHDQRLDTDEASLANKVDKVTGKGLSQVDNVTVTQHVAYGTVLSTIKTYKQDGTEVTSQVCNGINVDSALSDSSTNPVQNKVVKSALDDKVDKVTGKGLSQVDSVSVIASTYAGTKIGEVNVSGVGGATQGTFLFNGVVVDNALSSSSENPVQNKAIYDALNNLLPSKTVSGNPISISDASGLNAKALTVSMNPIQDLHGYDYPWVGGAGNNKMPPLTVGTYSKSGYQAVVSTDGKVKVTGTNSETGNVTINIPISANFNITSGQFVHIRNTQANANTVLTLGSIYTGMSHANKIWEYPNTETVSNFAIYIASTVGQVDFTIQVSVEDTNTVTDWTPYENICPISGRTEVSVTRTAGEDVETKTHQYSETIYGGTDDFVNGGLHITDAKFNVNGTETGWSADIPYSTQSYNRFVCTGIPSLGVTSNTEFEGITNLLTHTKSAQGINNGFRLRYVNGTNRLDIFTDAFDSLSALQAYLSSEPLQVCYELATPTIIETSAEEIELLKGQNVLWTDGDNVKFVYSADIKAYIDSKLA